jgi:hypothetical protein
VPFASDQQVVPVELLSPKHFVWPLLHKLIKKDVNVSSDK